MIIRRAEQIITAETAESAESKKEKAGKREQGRGNREEG
jgi:hypothetical protein